MSDSSANSQRHWSNSLPGACFACQELSSQTKQGTFQHQEQHLVSNSSEGKGTPLTYCSRDSDEKKHTKPHMPHLYSLRVRQKAFQIQEGKDILNALPFGHLYSLCLPSVPPVINPILLQLAPMTLLGMWEVWAKPGDVHREAVAPQ